MRRLAAVSLVLVVLLTSACATRHRSGEPALREQAHSEEVQLLERVTMYDDPALTEYLGRLAQRLTGAALRFHVLRDPTLALFTTPTGTVIVHTGLLAAADSEAQLAAALGHELAHVLLRDALEAGEPERVKPRLESEALASRTSAAIYARGLPVIGRAALTGYGRARERAADAAGLASLTRAGWDPTEAPVMFTRLAEWSREAGSRDQDEVATPGDLVEAGAPRLAELALDPVADDGAADAARDGEADPGRSLVVARERVEDEEAGRDRAAVPVDRVEVARARKTMPALHVDPRAVRARQAERRLRPFARRRLRIARPARVAIRARKPCRRFRRRTFGW